ncbi:plasma-membrane choline transporter-domain-containing protein [Syncephalis fuscata]|nr:plasma-membrane choline transporter-domain-containing protein [Syncephalis fuscata]
MTTTATTINTHTTTTTTAAAAANSHHISHGSGNNDIIQSAATLRVHSRSPLARSDTLSPLSSEHSMQASFRSVAFSTNLDPKDRQQLHVPSPGRSRSSNNQNHNNPTRAWQGGSDIYAEDPSSVDLLSESHSMTDRLINKSTGKSTDLASATRPGNTPADLPRKYRDRVFAALYLLSLAGFFITGLILLVNTSSSSLGRFLSRSTYMALKESLGLLGTMLVALCGVGAIWIFLLRNYVRILVRIHVILIPLIAVGVFIWMMTEAFVGPAMIKEPPSAGMIVLSIVSLFTAGGFGFYIKRRWYRLQQSITIIELSLDILKANPDLLAVGAFLNGLYVAFTALWLVFFNRVMLLGGIVPSPRGDPTTWVPDSSTGWLSFFYVVMFFWTTNILNDIQRITTANVVSQWYFLREWPVYGGRAAPALAVVATKQLGTASIAALIVTATRVTRVLGFIVGRLFRIHSGVVVVHGMQRWLIRSMASVSGYTPAYAGLTGLGFLASTQQVTRMFRRNLVHRFDTDTIVRVVLMLSSFCIAAISGMVAYTYAAQSLKTPHAALIGTIGGSINFFVARFYTRVLTAISDATFLCWTVDLDQNVNRCPAAHQAFALAERAADTPQDNQDRSIHSPISPV